MKENRTTTEKTNVKEEPTMNETFPAIHTPSFAEVSEVLKGFIKDREDKLPSTAEIHDYLKDYYSSKGIVIDTSAIADQDSPSDNTLYQLTIADFKRPDQKYLLMLCLSELMKNPDFSAHRISRGSAGYYENALLPQIAVNLVNEAAQKHNWDTNIFAFKNSYASIFSDLLYQAWQYRDMNWNDFYAAYFATPGGWMPYLIIDTHPTLKDMERFSPSFKKDYIDMIQMGDEEEHICNIMLPEIANYCVGNDFYFIFNEDMDRFPDDCKNAFMEDAKGIYEELLRMVQK